MDTPCTCRLSPDAPRRGCYEEGLCLDAVELMEAEAERERVRAELEHQPWTD